MNISSHVAKPTVKALCLGTVFSLGMTASAFAQDTAKTLVEGAAAAAEGVVAEGANAVSEGVAAVVEGVEAVVENVTAAAEEAVTEGAEAVVEGTDAAEKAVAEGAETVAETTDAAAETATETAPATAAEPEAIPGLTVGTPVDEIGKPYLLETHGDWKINCIKTPEGQTDPCSLFQLLLDDNDNAVAEISLFHYGTGEVDAGATVVVPLDTLLTQPLTLTVDGANGRRYPYTVCMPAGCQARLGLTKADVALFKKGAVATLTIVPFAAPDVKVPVDISLTGFTAGYARVTELNLAARKAAQ